MNELIRQRAAGHRAHETGEVAARFARSHAKSSGENAHKRRRFAPFAREGLQAGHGEAADLIPGPAGIDDQARVERVPV